MCIRIARELASDQDLFQQLQYTRRLPGEELARRSKVPIKTIEEERTKARKVTNVRRFKPVISIK
ncbi:MAG: hypothetical protein GX218_01705 [Clostridiaceae bacterium]|jgi:hypothetical protein|nr:hypothetical protein [Clostridiaceae bacterium]